MARPAWWLLALSLGALLVAAAILPVVDIAPALLVAALGGSLAWGARLAQGRGARTLAATGVLGALLALPALVLGAMGRLGLEALLLVPLEIVGLALLAVGGLGAILADLSR